MRSWQSLEVEVLAYYKVTVIKNHEKMENPGQKISWAGQWDNGHKL